MNSYSGAVSPGSPAQTRRLAGLSISKVAVDPQMSNNCYLLVCAATGERLMIDAAAEPETITTLLEGSPGAGLAGILTTHRHWDHHRALAAVVGDTGATTYAGAPDAAAITEQTGVAVDRRVGDGDTIRFGEVTVETIAITGHTPGSVCVLYRDPEGLAHLWTGDTLFPGGVGKTWSEEDFATLYAEVTTKLFDTLDDDTWFYPGHGDDSTIGAQRPHLQEWRERGW